MRRQSKAGFLRYIEIRPSRFVRLCMLIGFLIVMAAGCVTKDDAPVRLRVMHLNDTHSHLFPFSTDEWTNVGGAARVTRLVEDLRDTGIPNLFLHGGDAVAGSSSVYLDWDRIPLYGYRGLADIEAMNMMGFDAMVLGNHEFDFGKRWLDMLIERAEFPTISANVMKRELPNLSGDEPTPFVDPYIIVRKAGLKIGIVGLTTTEYMESRQFEVRDPLQVADLVLPELDRQCDFLIVLSHLGFEVDQELASSFPMIDLIVGGHSHTFLGEPMLLGSTMIVQAGAYGTHLGVLDLSISQGAIAEYTYELIHLDSAQPESPEVNNLLTQMRNIAMIPAGGFAHSTERQSELGKLTGKAAIAATNADYAMIASSAIHGPFEEGPLLARDFFPVFWPYRSRTLGPEKDLTEEQYLSLKGLQRDSLLHAAVGKSDGLKSLVVFVLSGEELERLIAENELKRGTDDYLQIVQADDVDKSTDAIRVVSTIDLLRRGDELGLPETIENGTVFKTELFEAVLRYLQDIPPLSQ